jgi:predicted RNase H-like nuclease (RuvC/YqgF family)
MIGHHGSSNVCMNTFNFNSDIESLISSLRQLEAENRMWKENTLTLQRSLDQLKRDFDDREEKRQIQEMQETIVKLSAQVAELQQSLNQFSVAENGFIYSGNNAIANREEDLDDDDEMVSHLLDLMEEPEEI